MIKKTLYFGNPAYLSLRKEQLVIRLPEIEKDASLPESFRQKAEVTKPIEDIGVVVFFDQFAYFRVPGQSGPDVAVLVECHGHAVSCAAHGYAKIHSSVSDSFRKRMGYVRIVHAVS